MGKQSNFHYLFKKVTQIFYCELKSNMLLYKKKKLLMSTQNANVKK